MMLETINCDGLWQEAVEKYLKQDITTIDEVIEMMEKGAAKAIK